MRRYGSPVPRTSALNLTARSLTPTRRHFDVILVWKLDRFSRSLRDLVNSLAELDTLGVDFVSLQSRLLYLLQVG